MNPTRVRFWFETGLAAVCLVLFVVTMISTEWIEFVFGVDPDGGDGSLEKLIVAAIALVALTATLRARGDLRRLRALRGSP
jgi:hypothetical protein